MSRWLLQLLFLTLTLGTSTLYAQQVKFYAGGKCTVKFPKMKKIKGVVFANENFETCCQIKINKNKRNNCLAEENNSTYADIMELHNYNSNSISNEVEDQLNIRFDDEVSLI